MDISELEKLEAEELVNLAETNIVDFRWDRSAIYKAAFEKYQQSGESEKSENMKKEILIFDLTAHNSPKKRFGFLMKGTTEEGEEVKYPNPEKDITEDIIEYCKTRAVGERNPLLRARYSDIVWEFARDVYHARLAMDAYLETCPVYLANEWDNELANSLDRAITIACQINDQLEIDKCLKNHYEYIEHLMQAERFRYLLEIIESILKRERRIKDQIVYEHLIRTIESVITYFSQNVPDSFHMQRSFMEPLITMAQIKKDNDELQKIKIRIAETYIEEADWKQVNYSSGNLVSAHFYELALRVYMDLGKFPDKVEELKVRLQRANEAALGTEYKTISSQIEIPKEKIEDYLFKRYKGRTSIEILQIVGMDKNLTPSYERSRQQAINEAKQFILGHIVPFSLMKGNICIKQIIEEDEKMEYATIENFRREYHLISSVLLNEIFALMEAENPKYLESLLQHLSDRDLISAKRLEIIGHGVRAFNKEEYVAAIHILIFQVEGILRDLLGNIGLPTFSYRNNEMRERMLSDVLNTLSQLEGIDNDFLRFIEIFLCDIRGDNYRNDVAHGLLPIEAFTREEAQLLLLILIKLASYRITKKEQ